MLQRHTTETGFSPLPFPSLPFTAASGPCSALGPEATARGGRRCCVRRRPQMSTGRCTGRANGGGLLGVLCRGLLSLPGTQNVLACVGQALLWRVFQEARPARQG
ncbi:unnamed protein product [Pipistrellus nathusii]|uniref:Uncharacterized protein n=1 Tax=Pipistrellus nathusii TaxID=59473 RepID=A0ABP0AGP1_PIPNA